MAAKGPRPTLRLIRPPRAARRVDGDERHRLRARLLRREELAGPPDGRRGALRQAPGDLGAAGGGSARRRRRSSELLPGAARGARGRSTSRAARPSRRRRPGPRRRRAPTYDRPHDDAARDDRAASHADDDARPCRRRSRARWRAPPTFPRTATTLPTATRPRRTESAAAVGATPADPGAPKGAPTTALPPPRDAADHARPHGGHAAARACHAPRGSGFTVEASPTRSRLGSRSTARAAPPAAATTRASSRSSATATPGTGSASAATARRSRRRDTMRKLRDGRGHHARLRGDGLSDARHPRRHPKATVRHRRSAPAASYSRLARGLPGLIAIGKRLDAGRARDPGGPRERRSHAFLKVHRGPYGFLLESVEQGGEAGARYSFLGTEPARVLRVRAAGRRRARDAGWRDRCGATTRRSARRAEAAARRRTARSPCPGLPRFAGGAVGYVGYDMVRTFERLPSPRDGRPRAARRVPDARRESLLVFDNVAQKIKVVAHAARARRRRRRSRLRRARSRRIDELVGAGSRRASSSRAAPAVAAGEVRSNVTPEAYQAMVAPREGVHPRRRRHPGRARAALRAAARGRAVQRLPLPAHREPVAVSSSTWRSAATTVAGASPEVMARVEDGEVTVRPIAGHAAARHRRARGRARSPPSCSPTRRSSPSTSCSSTSAATTSAASRGSAPVAGRPSASSIERYSHVMHLVSNVRGAARRGRDAFDVLRARRSRPARSRARPRSARWRSSTSSSRSGAGSTAARSATSRSAARWTRRSRSARPHARRPRATCRRAPGIVADSDPEAEHRGVREQGARGRSRRSRLAESALMAAPRAADDRQLRLVHLQPRPVPGRARRRRRASRRNDAIALDEIAALAPDAIVVSPGPCTPNEAGISVPLIQRFAGAHARSSASASATRRSARPSAATIVRAARIMHGKTSPIHARRARASSRGSRTRSRRRAITRS